MTTAGPDSEPPRRVARYEILRELGRGGMALVYLARQPDLDRLVALKELASFAAHDQLLAHRFLRESRLAGALNHPNVVTVYEYLEHNGTPYISMEYLARGSLRPFVPHLSLPQCVGVMEGVLAGLAAAELIGIVHRDLKPENLLVTNDGHVKIADFGIAKAVDGVTHGLHTQTGTTMGTPTYMAPEQALGQPVTSVTDLYSVGVIAYELMVGRIPFESDSPMALLLRHVNEAPPPPRSIRPELDPGLASWIERLLVKNPADRTTSARAAWEDLEEIALRLLGPRWRHDALLLHDPAAPAGARPVAPPPGTSDALARSATSSDYFTVDPGRFRPGRPYEATGIDAPTPSPSERSPTRPPAGPPRAPSPAERGEADMPPGSPPPSPHTDDAARAQVPSVSALGSAQAAALDRDRTASSPPDTPTAPDADQPTVPPPSASAARAPEAPRPRPGGLRRLRWVFAVLIALVGAAAAAYAVRPRNPQPSSSAAPSSSPADRARRVHVSSRAYEATLPAGWRTVCRDVEGTCFGVSLPSGAHRSAFLLGSGKDTSTVTIDRTPLKGARVNSASIIGDVEAKHAGDRGFRRLPGFPREVRLRRRSARELRFSTGDQRGSQAVVVYGFVERGSAYVLTGTSTRGTAAMTATKMAAGTLLTH